MTDGDHRIVVQAISSHQQAQISVEGLRSAWPDLLQEVQRRAREQWRRDLAVHDDGYPLASLRRPGDPDDDGLFGDERQYGYCSAFRATD